PAVLSSEKFFGPASFGYAAAAEAASICRKLFCYCGCDMTDSHTSLLDCFTSYHGVDCKICQDEAIMARQMQKEGASINAIQDAVDQSFHSHYPWGKPTDALEKYRASLPPNAVGRQLQSPITPPDTLHTQAKTDKDPNCCKKSNE